MDVATRKESAPASQRIGRALYHFAYHHGTAAIAAALVVVNVVYYLMVSLISCMLAIDVAITLMYQVVMPYSAGMAIISVLLLAVATPWIVVFLATVLDWRTWFVYYHPLLTSLRALSACCLGGVYVPLFAPTDPIRADVVLPDAEGTSCFGAVAVWRWVFPAPAVPEAPTAGLTIEQRIAEADSSAVRAHARYLGVALCPLVIMAIAFGAGRGLMAQEQSQDAGVIPFLVLSTIFMAATAVVDLATWRLRRAQDSVRLFVMYRPEGRHTTTIVMVLALLGLIAVWANGDDAMMGGTGAGVLGVLTCVLVIAGNIAATVVVPQVFFSSELRPRSSILFKVLAIVDTVVLLIAAIVVAAVYSRHDSTIVWFLLVMAVLLHSAVWINDDPACLVKPSSSLPLPLPDEGNADEPRAQRLQRRIDRMDPTARAHLAARLGPGTTIDIADASKGLDGRFKILDAKAQEDILVVAGRAWRVGIDPARAVEPDHVPAPVAALPSAAVVTEEEIEEEMAESPVAATIVVDVHLEGEVVPHEAPPQSDVESPPTDSKHELGKPDESHAAASDACSPVDTVLQPPPVYRDFLVPRRIGHFIVIATAILIMAFSFVNSSGHSTVSRCGAGLYPAKNTTAHEVSMQYDVCHILRSGFTIVDFTAAMVTSYTANTSEAMNVMFPDDGVVDVKTDVDGPGVFVSYSLMRFPKRNATMVIIRGSYRSVDWLQNIYLMSDSLVLQLGSVLLPLPLSLGLEATLVQYISSLKFGMTAYATPVVNAAKRVQAEYPDDTIYIVGHSLGGFTTNIVAALGNFQGVAFSPMGTGMQYKRFGFDRGLADRVLASVIPVHDLVPKVDKQLGMLQYVTALDTCDASNFFCHGSGLALRTLATSCGDPLGRVQGACPLI
jgi:hypothetical protein